MRAGCSSAERAVSPITRAHVRAIRHRRLLNAQARCYTTALVLEQKPLAAQKILAALQNELLALPELSDSWVQCSSM